MQNIPYICQKFVYDIIFEFKFMLMWGFNDFDH